VVVEDALYVVVFEQLRQRMILGRVDLAGVLA
jgi:hypothetical protein